MKNCYSAEIDIEPKNKSVCFADTVDYEVTLRNTGRLADTYTLKFGDEVMPVFLESGNSETFAFSYSVPGEPGTYELKAVAESEHAGAEATDSVNVKSAEECFTIQLEDGAEVVNVEPASAATVEFYIKNTGDKAENFILSADAIEWVYVSPESITLDVGEETSGYLYITPPYDAETGVYSTEVMAFSESGLGQSMRVVVGVVPNASEANATVPAQQPGINLTDITGTVVMGERPLWKTLVVAAITIVIIIILIVRFVFLVK